MKQKLLIIDDDKKLRELLTEYLSEFEFETDVMVDGRGVMEKISSFGPDLIILDLMLPGRDGFEILKEIRLNSYLPIIMLTARGEDTDRIVGLELGADDYLAKPFNPRELLARIKAILRRTGSVEEGNGKAGKTGDILTAGAIVLDRKKLVLEIHGKTIEASTTEIRLLEALMSREGSPVSRDELMNHSRGRDHIAFDRSIDVHISKLRAHLEGAGSTGRHIKTVWGIGYMFVGEP